MNRRLARSAVALAMAAVACRYDPTAPSVDYERGACSAEASFCDGRTVQPLAAADEWRWTVYANEWIDREYGAGTHMHPAVTYHACFFDVGGTCAAGYTESESRIHVSTAQPERTGPLVCHEVAHSRFHHQFGSFDAAHTRKYPC